MRRGSWSGTKCKREGDDEHAVHQPRCLLWMFRSESTNKLGGTVGAAEGCPAVGRSTMAIIGCDVT